MLSQLTNPMIVNGLMLAALLASDPGPVRKTRPPRYGSGERTDLRYDSPRGDNR
jgi:hypothetical protein